MLHLVWMSAQSVSIATGIQSRQTAGRRPKLRISNQVNIVPSALHLLPQTSPSGSLTYEPGPEGACPKRPTRRTARAYARGNAKHRADPARDGLDNQRLSDTCQTASCIKLFAWLMIRSQAVAKTASSTVRATRTQLSTVVPKETPGMTATLPCSRRCSA